MSLTTKHTTSHQAHDLATSTGSRLCVQAVSTSGQNLFLRLYMSAHPQRVTAVVSGFGQGRGQGFPTLRQVTVCQRFYEHSFDLCMSAYSLPKIANSLTYLSGHAS